MTSSDRPSSIPPFSTLEQRLAQETAGYHDLDRVVLFGRHGLDEATARHELMHDRFLYNTADGQVLVTLHRLAVSARASNVVRRTASLSKTKLISESRNTHEAAATYLGLKELDPSAHADAMRQLPDEYMVYFQRIATVVDPITRCSYLQSSIAAAALELCFYSPLIVQLAEWDGTTILETNTDTNVEVRLTAILASLPALAVDLCQSAQVIVDATARAAGVEPWDVHDEQGWERHPQIAHAADVAIVAKLHDMVATASQVPFITERERHSAVLKLASKWQGVLDMATPGMATGGLTQLALDAPNGPILQSSWSVSNACVEIRPKSIAVDFSIPHLSALTDLTRYHVVDFGAATHNRPKGEYVATCWQSPTRQGTPDIARCSFSDVCKHLHDRMSRRDFPGVRTLTCGTDEPEGFKDLISSLAKSSSEDYGSQLGFGPDGGDIYLYLHGRWMHWIDGMIRSTWTLRYRVIEIDPSDDMHMAEQLTKRNMRLPHLHVVQSSGLPFVFFRFFNASVSERTSPLLAAAVDAGMLHIMDDSQIAQIGDRVANRFGHILKYWQRF